MRSEFNEAICEHNQLYKEGMSQDQFYKGADWAWQYQQSKVGELQEDLEEAALSQMKLYEENNELQKRVDAVQRLIESWNMTNFDKSTHFNDGYEEGCFNCARELEQALKGGCDANQ